jgi:hypothetical protein
MPVTILVGTLWAPDVRAYGYVTCQQIVGSCIYITNYIEKHQHATITTFVMEAVLIGISPITDVMVGAQINIAFLFLTFPFLINRLPKAVMLTGITAFGRIRIEICNIHWFGTHQSL